MHYTLTMQEKMLPFFIMIEYLNKNLKKNCIHIFIIKVYFNIIIPDVFIYFNYFTYYEILDCTLQKSEIDLVPNHPQIKL